MRFRRVLALILTCAFLLTGCTVSIESDDDTESSVSDVSEAISNDNAVDDELGFDLTDFSSEDTLRYIDDCIYTDVVNTLDSDAYFVENVETIYYSQEYIDELEFNSLENLYFGYNLSDLNDLFKGTKYVFDIDNNNNTIVKKAEVFDDTTGKIIKNVAIGTGVILVCVTVSLATGGAAPAVSAIFMASAKAATIGSLSSAGIGAAVATMTTDFSSQSLDDSLKNIALQASEDFKWGAVIGAVTGGAGKAASLFGESKQTAFTINEYAKIQKESKYPIDLIKQFKSMDEYKVYFEEAKAFPQMVNGKLALLQNIDLNFKSKLSDGTEVTNLQRMLNGKAPVYMNSEGKIKYFQLHHTAQKADGTLVVLTEEQHLGNSSILNTIGKESEIDRNAFNIIRKKFWKNVGKLYEQGLIKI